jgi:5,10-methylene-tetrahydrofolate dehydrogenase/methenyl tetrahydrofolate cyclohydrolase
VRGRGVHLLVIARNGIVGPRVLQLLAEEDHEVTVYNRGLT